MELWNRYKRVTAIAASIAGITALFISALAMYFAPAANKSQLERLSRDIAVIKANQQLTNNTLKEVAEPKIPKGATIKTGGTGADPFEPAPAHRFAPLQLPLLLHPACQRAKPSFIGKLERVRPFLGVLAATSGASVTG